MRTGITKLAEIGGTGNRQSFEQVVASLAHRYIKDNAPSLMQGNYEQGFQLLEKSDDDTRAVGVVGFNVNQMQIYCPVFFLNGEIKGNELMYLADQDLFVPVKEAWLNKILGKKPILIGEGITRDRHRQGYSNPDLNVFKDSPVKMSSAQYPEWVIRGLPAICHIIGNSLEKTAANAVSTYKRMRRELDLRNFIELADANGVYHLKEAVAKAPFIKMAFESCYGNSAFLDKIYNCKDIQERGFKLLYDQPGKRQNLDGTKAGSVLDDTDWIPNFIKNPLYKSSAYVSIMSYSEVINDDESPIPLTESEKEELARKGYVVMDSRKDKDVSQVVKKITDKSFVNPTSNGVYDVLMTDGTCEKRVCIKRTGTVVNGEPMEHSNWNDIGEYLVINPETNVAITTSKKDIWCGKVYDELNPDGFSTVSKDRIIGNYVIFNKGRRYIGPLKGKKTFNNLIQCDSLDIVAAPGGNRTIKYIKIGPKGSALAMVETDVLNVPEDAKMITVEMHSERQENEHDKLGQPKLLKLATAGLTEDVKLYVYGDSCSINGKIKESAFSGLCSLIKDYGLREKQAAALMKEAAANTMDGHTVRFTIKRAAPLDYSNASGFPFPGDQSNQYGNVMGVDMSMAPNNQGLYTNPTDAYSVGSGPYANTLDPSFPQQDAQNLQKAVQNGQQEVFDTSMLKQLLTNVNASDHIDKLSSKLVRAMDNVGRLLFIFYWKGNQFKELYGPQELPELEGGLRKAFETLGDIVLFLQRKATEPITYPGESVINLANIQE